MGGNAFAEHSTPRLPTALYNRLLSRTIELLRPLYARIGSPVPGPGKLDHGDIDITVSGPKDDENPSRENVSTILHAVQTTGHKPTISYLVPLSPVDIAALPANSSLPQSSAHFVQVDIHEAPSFSTYNWLLFNHSHGDLFSLLGSTIRPFGLTITDTGTYIRIAEMEATGEGKRARILVTDDPQRCWEEVLGLSDWKSYFSPRRWLALEDMYASVAHSRFFLFSSFQKERALKSNDRQRMRSRAAFRDFVEEWLPKLQREEPGFGERGKELTREMVWEEVMERFEGVRDEADRTLEAWRKEQRKITENRKKRDVRKALAGEEERYRDAWMEWSQKG